MIATGVADDPAPAWSVDDQGLIYTTGTLIGVVNLQANDQTLFLKLTGQASSGFATVILLQLIIGSLLMISLGIIGEYLARIYQEVKARPRYIVSESIESDAA